MTSELAARVLRDTIADGAMETHVLLTHLDGSQQRQGMTASLFLGAMKINAAQWAAERGQPYTAAELLTAAAEVVAHYAARAA